MGSWACARCTFINPPSQRSACTMCLAPSSSSALPPQWSCRACTFSNAAAASTCEMCADRPRLDAFVDHDLEPDEISHPSLGNVFLPLQRCGSKRPPPPAGEPGLSWRTRTEMSAREDEIVVDLDVIENADLYPKQHELKILSYNVWFREDLEVHMRMEAIGYLIHQHSPDLICFQEVTPNIYEIFQNSSWWRLYTCSISQEMAAMRGYFCMQLSKFPVKSFTCKPFSNTSMGRELCLVDLNLGGTKLVIATSHLESPCPGPPKWDQMFSKERVAQAEESVNFLKDCANVVFCGDMNWDDKLDGAFPLPKGWVDAWTELRPEDDGYTYDTKANKMLSGNRALRKRLDRVICGLQDFKIESIHMVGMEAIPGLSHKKEKKGRAGLQTLVLPVLPSDHFGLLLKICSSSSSAGLSNHSISVN